MTVTKQSFADRRATVDAIRLLYLSGTPLLELCMIARDMGFVSPLRTVQYALTGIPRRSAAIPVKTH